MNYLDFYKNILQESRKEAKELVVQGKLSPNDFEELVRIDPSQTKKYTGWLARQWIAKSVTDIDELRNKIEEYDAFVKSGKAKTKDIFQFKSFADLKKEVDELNAMGSESKSELRDDYEIIMDDDKFLIAVPHTHEASRYLGLSKFQYRDCEGGGKDSAWCTTYKAPDHFNDYYFKQHITFYYIKLKNEAMIELAKAAFPARGGAMVVTAVLVDKNGKVSSCYDGDDKVMSGAEIAKFRKIIGI
jgi:hypothetical protein